MNDLSIRCTASGKTPVNPDDASVPDSTKRPDGQHVDHWVLCETERAKGFVRPVRNSYQHVGIAGPDFSLRDLTAEETARFGNAGYAKYEDYKGKPPIGCSPSAAGRFWTRAELDMIGKGCGTVTSMPRSIAETYARQPGYYGSTFCCGCGNYPLLWRKSRSLNFHATPWGGNPLYRCYAIMCRNYRLPRPSDSREVRPLPRDRGTPLWRRKKNTTELSC